MSRFDQIREAEKEEMLLLDGYRHATDGYEENPCDNPECGRYRVALRKNGKYICEKCCWDQRAMAYDTTGEI